MDEQGLELKDAIEFLRSTVTKDFVRWSGESKSMKNMQKMLMLVTYKYWRNPGEYEKFKIHEDIFIERLKQIATNKKPKAN